MKLLFAICYIVFAGIISSGSENIIHLNKPLKSQSEIPVLAIDAEMIAEIKNKAGIKDKTSLKESNPILIIGDKQLASYSGIKGEGTEESPYVIANLSINISDKAGIDIQKTTSHLIIENILFTGQGNTFPSLNYGIEIRDSKNITIRNCEASKCNGFYFGACNIITIEYCKLESIINGVFSSGGSQIRALHNYVEDSTKYGIFLYNGPEHEVAWNYVAWTGREGIGTNGGNSFNHYYHDNIILHCGWTAINLEVNFRKEAQKSDNSKIQNNIIGYSHYGIILMGRDVVCSGNQVFYSSQDGITVLEASGLVIKENLICGAGLNGIQFLSGNDITISENRLYQTHCGVRLPKIPNVKIANNQFYQFFTGINSAADGMQVDNNEFGYGRNGIILGSNSNEVIKNIFQHNIIASQIKGDNNKIQDNQYKFIGDVIRISGNKNIFENNQCSNINYGCLMMNDATNCEINTNSFTNTTANIFQLKKSNNNKITSNKVTNGMNSFGFGSIELTSADDNIFRENIFGDLELLLRFRDANCHNNIFEKNIYEDVKIKLSDDFNSITKEKANTLDFILDENNNNKTSKVESHDKLIIDEDYSLKESSWIVFKHKISQGNKRELVREKYSAKIHEQDENNNSIMMKFSETPPGVGPWGSGLALIFPKPIEAGQRIHLSLQARLVEGNANLYIVRAFGGSDRKSIKLGKAWEKIELNMLPSSNSPTNHLMFSLHSPLKPNEAIDGTIELKDIKIKQGY